VAGADTRLAIYGTLAPGRANHHQLADLNGRWSPGTVNGTLMEQGWGARFGYPGIILDAAGGPVKVQLLESPDLPQHWSRLDEFEGSGYRRVATTVDTEDGAVEAFIYELADQGDRSV
jgi:gamma-glutamylcyclotransferase (GGCT)/AIG2-like uncharacterized protein YtfP